MVSGEGIALGLLLMMVGAKMPKQLSEVAVVCVHRRETLAPIEKMYNELVNMKGHREFYFFSRNFFPLPVFEIDLALSCIARRRIPSLRQRPDSSSDPRLWQVSLRLRLREVNDWVR